MFHLKRSGSLVVLAFVVICGSLACRIGPARTSTNPELSLSGRETWEIAGRTWEVQETALLLFADRQGMLVVKALYDGRPGAEQTPLAQELARYALEHGYVDHAREKLREADRDELADSIGVALIRQVGTSMASVSSGYRYNFTFEELQQ